MFGDLNEAAAYATAISAALLKLCSYVFLRWVSFPPPPSQPSRVPVLAWGKIHACGSHCVTQQHRPSKLRPSDSQRLSAGWIC